MITGFYLGLLGFLYFKISMEVINARRGKLVSLGSGDNNQIAQIVSAHSNFISYVPICMLLLYLVEHAQFFPELLIHLFGLFILLGRFFHFLAFRKEMNFKFRRWGMYMTLWPLIVLSLANVLVYIKSIVG